MKPLSSSLRKQLEVAVLAARRASELASHSALDALGVFADRRPLHLDNERAALRNGLRAKCRQLGGDRALLEAACAYEQWHRLLFARFLAENQLLIHPRYRAPVSLSDCSDLAEEFGEPDGWSLAARFAAEILPGIFRLDDPCARLRLAPEGRESLERILTALPAEIFAAADALGWVYQFWQRDKKDEVNDSGRKIGGADLGPVTQLFTENYMVRFLLENSLGAWWASRHPESSLLNGFEYLRLSTDRQPAAGSFDEWPQRVAEVTVMDPCCGSGHFLVEAFSLLWRMRVEEEGLTPEDAQDSVLRDNLFGLELDSRCVQIAMFALALEAWKAGGQWRQLAIPNIACSGIPVYASSQDWESLAQGNERIGRALARLHVLFEHADTLGSLIDPRRAAELSISHGLQRSLYDVDWHEVVPLLKEAVSRETVEPATAVLGADASSLADAADLLSRKYTLVVTNPPYLPRTKFGSELVRIGDQDFPESKNELATMFLDRARRLTTESGGAYAFVMPQTWLTLVRQKALRERLLSTDTWRLLARLGLEAFASISSGYVDVFLGIWQRGLSAPDSEVSLLDCQDIQEREAKARNLVHGEITRIPQAILRKNPDSRVLWQSLTDQAPLGMVADSHQGIKTSDNPRFSRHFWELPRLLPGWSRVQSSPSGQDGYTGRSLVVFWEDGHGKITEVSQDGATFRGQAAWNRRGVAISEMGYRYATLYTGEIFDGSVIVVTPNNATDVGALWAFLRSSDFEEQLAIVNPKLSVSTSSVVRVPFDLARWRLVAKEAGPLPEPSSNDPTQWLFAGRPQQSTAPLQVAVALLLGYMWPEQTTLDEIDRLADTDGIVCLPSVAGEPPGAERLHQVLSAAFGESFGPARVAELILATGSKKKGLSDWLRDDFFAQHCAEFGHRPFIWHVWDGQRDGFSALVNYHRLDRKLLERLTYTHLGQDWVERQRAGVRDGAAGAETRLAAALELRRRLEAILTGEQPYDIYVRWKDLYEQPLGWDPDLNDGIRVNIRPFVEADVLRSAFNIHWRKDRGVNPDGSERRNDPHLSLTDKRAARAKAGRK